MCKLNQSCGDISILTRESSASIQCVLLTSVEMLEQESEPQDHRNTNEL